MRPGEPHLALIPLPRSHEGHACGVHAIGVFEALVATDTGSRWGTGPGTGTNWALEL